jgi:hypothetical protein
MSPYQKRHQPLTPDNSSRPPSSDGLGKPPARRRERRGGRAPGKQPDAPGAHLAQVPDPDEVVVHRPVACGGCGGDLTLAPVTGMEARQVVDLPEVRLWVCEHRAERRQCACGRITAGGDDLLGGDLPRGDPSPA